MCANGEMAKVKLMLTCCDEPKKAVNLADYDGGTPLMLAAAEGHHELVQYLMEVGADPKAKDRFGLTASDAAALALTQLAEPETSPV